MEDAARQTRVCLEALYALPTQQCHTFLAWRLMQHVGARLNIPAITVDIERPLCTLGLDTTAALHLQQHLADEFALPTLADVALPQMSLRELCRLLAYHLGFAPKATATASASLALLPSSDDLCSGWLQPSKQDRVLSLDEIHGQAPVPRPEAVEMFMATVSQRHLDGVSLAV